MSDFNIGEFQAHTEKIEQLVERVNAIADTDARAIALDLLQSLMDLHGAALNRIVELANDSGERGRKMLDKLGADPLVCGLLVLYGLHPLDFHTRVQRGIEAAQSAVRKKGGSVELLGIGDNTVRVKIEASGHGCGSSPDALEQAVEQAILEAAPDVVEIVAEGLPAAKSGFVPLNQLQPAADPQPAQASPLNSAAHAAEPKQEEKAYEESAA